ncbi:hypothetical protein QTP81_15900 [Alteromonas sp. ASW11-36]|uniref:Uncharacterized protein n=1 Tax=Alteromonas arenosi TaxID=3055817 RepID=A0ABT7T0W2_9ALTE|nr:hypothetical protein [Alteromonas sp. ASW11-36]MDM7862088.1 hypothetical protein [Alteromonas sp. ASW11-36]
MYKIFSFVADDWQFTAELQSLITTNWSSQGNVNTQIQELVLAYNDEFVIANWGVEKSVSLSSTMPLQLMEVFRHTSISSWLEQYKPLRPQQISPQYTFGNIAIALSSEHELRVASNEPVTPMELSHVTEEQFTVAGTRLTGWYAGYQFLFAKLTNNSLYPLDFTAQKPNESWVFMPFYSCVELQHLSTSRKQLNSYLHAQSLFFMHLNRCAGGVEQKGTKQLNIHNGLLTRFDIHNNSLCKVNHLSLVLGCDCRESSDFLEFIKMCVSANKHLEALDLAASELILLLLVRDLICRLFTDASHRCCFNLVYGDDWALFAPIVWDQNSPAEAHPVLQWPIQFMLNDRPDYAAICAALSDYAEPHELLFNLTESAENLMKINSLLLEDDPEAGAIVGQMYGLPNVAQKLHHLELIL